MAFASPRIRLYSQASPWTGLTNQNRSWAPGHTKETRFQINLLNFL